MPSDSQSATPTTSCSEKETEDGDVDENEDHPSQKWEELQGKVEASPNGSGEGAVDVGKVGERGG